MFNSNKIIIKNKSKTRRDDTLSKPINASSPSNKHYNPFFSDNNLVFVLKLNFDNHNSLKKIDEKSRQKSSSIEEIKIEKTKRKPKLIQSNFGTKIQSAPLIESKSIEKKEKRDSVIQRPGSEEIKELRKPKLDTGLNIKTMKLRKRKKKRKKNEKFCNKENQIKKTENSIIPQENQIKLPEINQQSNESNFHKKETKNFEKIMEIKRDKNLMAKEIERQQILEKERLKEEKLKEMNELMKKIRSTWIINKNQKSITSDILPKIENEKVPENQNTPQKRASVFKLIPLKKTFDFEFFFSKDKEYSRIDLYNNPIFNYNKDYIDSLTFLKNSFKTVQTESKFLQISLPIFTYVNLFKNDEKILEKVMKHRINWKDTKNDKTFNLKWKYEQRGIEYSKLALSNDILDKQKMVNHYEFNSEITDKRRLFINLVKFCDVCIVQILVYKF